MDCKDTQECETLHSLALGENQDNNSNTKPSYNLVEDAKDQRSKRKASTDEGSSKKKLRADGVTNASVPYSLISDYFSTKGSKRKADAAEESPNKKIRSSSVPTDSNSDEFVIDSRESSSTDEDATYDMYDFSVKTSRAEFEAKYIELSQIGKGGFGAVMEGYKTKDMEPVAIKHIIKEKILYTEVVQNGNVLKVIHEVALMVKAAGGTGSPGKSAAISLLECYDLEEELILVIERPHPSMDLYKYRKAKGGNLAEDEAKDILKQMVDAAIEMHTNGVFHRDIKLENTLVETRSNVPRVRVIDFGCGALVRKGYYHKYIGTFAKAPPEWYRNGEYKARPTTVWQLGALLYDLMHKDCFETIDLFKKGVKVNSSLSIDCHDFLQMCMDQDPNRRATLEQLRSHPWLR